MRNLTQRKGMEMKIAEYSEVEDKPSSKETTLKKRNNGGRTYRLVHRSPGWECAGSMARLRETECWSVLFYLDGAQHGRGFSSLKDAESLFDKWTTTPN